MYVVYIYIYIYIYTLQPPLKKKRGEKNKEKKKLSSNPLVDCRKDSLQTRCLYGGVPGGPGDTE